MIPLTSIDVWWQSHLIRPHDYAQFCLDNFGSVIDRDMCTSDTSSPSIIATAALWKNEYKTDYIDPIIPSSLSSELSAKAVSESKETVEQKAAALTTLVAATESREIKGNIMA